MLIEAIGSGDSVRNIRSTFQQTDKSEIQ